MLYFNLAPIFAARNITRPGHFLVKAGFSYHAANLIIGSNYRQPRLDHIERLCKVLTCTPNDILAWKPDADDRIPQDHPLHSLAPKPMPGLLIDKLKDLPLDQLAHIQSLISDELKKATIAGSPE